MSCLCRYVGINASDINWSAGRYGPVTQLPMDAGFEVCTVCTAVYHFKLIAGDRELEKLLQWVNQIVSHFSMAQLWVICLDLHSVNM